MHKNETYCGSCYGAQDTAGECCNTCEQVMGHPAGLAAGFMLS